MKKEYVVRLDPEERAQVFGLIAPGKAVTRTPAHACILLRADLGPDGQPGPSGRVCPRCASAPQPCKLDGLAEAHLVTLACPAPPDVRAHWTLRLLVNELVTLAIVDGVALETGCQAIQQRGSSRG